MWIYHSVIEEHLGCVQILVIMNKTAVNICVQVLCEHKFYSYEINA